MTFDHWEKMLDFNLNGTLYVCKTVLPYMVEQNYGKIVNVSSTTAKTAHKKCFPILWASKAAVNYLTMHLALEMALHDIYVNAVCPGPVETDMSNQWTDEYLKEVIKSIPLNKLGTSQDIGESVLFLDWTQFSVIMMVEIE
ncbi:SDR family NAD(P)-dependent oxidoreductase [Bacillus safensis]|uniref:SDR family NAD(P)-dependent oxidoreductase n=1 Tax=Bacillus safensis TaxID=561879 RepID=UPI0037F9EFBE